MLNTRTPTINFQNFHRADTRQVPKLLDAYMSGIRTDTLSCRGAYHEENLLPLLILNYSFYFKDEFFWNL